MSWTLFENWHCVLPPNRPTRQVETLVSNACIARPRGRALILGGTTEFREICSRYDMEVTLVDSNPHFVESLSKQCSSGSYKFIEGDWFSHLPECNGSFDLVLSHFTLGNVPREDYDLLQSLAFDCLRAGGIVVDRVLHYRNGLSNWEEIEREFRNRSTNLQSANDLNCFGVFRSPTVAEVGSVNSETSADALRSCLPWLESTINLMETYVTPRGASWSYNGHYRDPTTVYGLLAKHCQEHPDEQLSYRGTASTVVAYKGE